jgi:hypothetical protein
VSADRNARYSPEQAAAEFEKNIGHPVTMNGPHTPEVDAMYDATDDVEDALTDGEPDDEPE